LSDTDVIEYWRFLTDEFLPLIQKAKGVHAVKYYSGAGALRADLRIVIDMDHAGVYESLLVDAELRQRLGRFYGAIELSTSTQTFFREVTPELVKRSVVQVKR
jgi:hypothetical protein